MSDLEPIGQLLPARMLARRRSDPVADAARAVWAEVVGERVSRHSAPIRTSGDALVVHCSSSTWASELTLLAGHVGERLTSRLGEQMPARLRFEVGELPTLAPQPQALAPAVDPTLAEHARSLASGVADQRLRDALANAITRANSGSS